MNKRTLAAATVVVAMLAPAQQALSAEVSTQVTQPVKATQWDLSPARTYGVPSFAVDPDDARHILAAAVDLRTQTCGIMESTDAGQSWSSLESSPSPDNFPLCLMTNSHTTQGKLTFGSDKRLYYALGGWDVEDGANRSILVGRSQDMGASWQTTVVREARGLEGKDQQPNRPLSGFAVDRSGKQDTLYVSWRQQNRLTDPNKLPNLPVMAVSTDGGATFSEPVSLVGDHFSDPAARTAALVAKKVKVEPPPAPTPTSVPTPQPSAEGTPTQAVVAPAPPGSAASPAASAAPLASASAPPPAGTPAADPDQQVNFGGSNPVLAVDDKGTAYAAWVSSYANVKQTPPPAHFLTRTSDGGKTLEVFQITPFSSENVNGFGGLDLVWSPEGGNDGTLHFVYEGARTPGVASEADVFYRQSSDRGQTWSEPVAINDDDPEQLFYSGIAKLGLAPNGRLDVAWFDTRSDPGLTQNDVYYAYSTDNGRSWSKNLRITDQSIDRKVGVFAQNFDLNGPPGLASTNAYAMIGWDDTRTFDSVTQGQDIYVAAVQFETLAATSSSTGKYLLAGAVGLLTVSLLFVLLALLVRRRQDGLASAR